MNSLVGEVEGLHLNYVALVHHSINAQHTLYNVRHYALHECKLAIEC